MVEQVVHHHRSTGTLSEQVPGLGQAQRLGLGEQRLHHILINREIIDAGACATGQTMTRKIAGNHHETLVQRPIQHMAIQPHMVVEPVEHEHRRHRRRRPPHLGHHFEPIHLETPQPARHRNFARRQVQPVEPLVDPRLGAERLRIHQGPQAFAQTIGVKGDGHKGSKRKTKMNIERRYSSVRTSMASYATCEDRSTCDSLTVTPCSPA